MGSDINTLHEVTIPCQHTYKTHRDRLQMQTDIEVLKSRLENLNNSINHVNDKLDLIMQMQVQIVRLQEQFDTARSAITTAASETKALSERVNHVENSIDGFRSSGRTALLVGAILFSVIQWYVIRQIADIDTNADLLTNIDRRVYLMEETAAKYPSVLNGLNFVPGGKK